MPSMVPDRSRVWLALLTIYVVWGSTYLGIAVAIETMPPLLMGAIRFGIAGLLLLAWAWFREGAAFRMPTPREWRDALIIGGLLFGGGNGLVGVGEQTVPSGIAAVLIALVAVWFAVFSRIGFGDRVPLVVGVGIAVGIGGVAILAWPVGVGVDRLDPFGVAVLIAAPMFWAAGSIFAARRAQLPSSASVTVAIQMLAGSAVLVVEGLVVGELPRLTANVSLESLISVGYLVVFGSLVAFSAYSWLLRHAPLPLVGTYAFVNPVVAVFLGMVFLAEPLTPRMIIAAAVIVVGVALVILGRGRLRASRSTAPEGSTKTRLEAAGSDAS